MGGRRIVYCVLCFGPTTAYVAPANDANDANADADISTARSAASQKTGETYYDDALVRCRKRVVRPPKRLIGSIKFVSQGLLMSIHSRYASTKRNVL